MRIIEVRNFALAVPSSAKDWGLNGEDFAAVDQTAKELNEQVDALVEQWTAACHDGEMAPTSLGIGSAWRRLFEPVLRRHAGEADAEVVDRCSRLIDRIARVLGYRLAV